jgi:hypothetical protein
MMEAGKPHPGALSPDTARINRRHVSHIQPRFRPASCCLLQRNKCAQPPRDELCLRTKYMWMASHTLELALPSGKETMIMNRRAELTQKRPGLWKRSERTDSASTGNLHRNNSRTFKCFQTIYRKWKPGISENMWSKIRFSLTFLLLYQHMLK